MPKFVAIITPGKKPETFRYDDGDIPPIVVPDEPEEPKDAELPEPKPGEKPS